MIIFSFEAQTQRAKDVCLYFVLSSFFHSLNLDSRVRNEPNASLLALGDCARVTYPAALQRCKFDTPLLAAGLLI